MKKRKEIRVSKLYCHPEARAPLGRKDLKTNNLEIATRSTIAQGKLTPRNDKYNNIWL